MFINLPTSTVSDAVSSNMSFDTLTAIVLMNVAFTIVLWRIVTQRGPHKLKRKFVKQLVYSQPITPKHQPPKTAELESLFSKEFDDFADFANVVNGELAGQYVGSPFRLQELPETELTLPDGDGPEFGRSYAVFYNQARIGKLEVEQPYRHTADVTTYIHLDYVRLLSLDTIQVFLAIITRHTCDFDRPDGGKCAQAQHQEIDRAVTKVLWQSNQVDVHDFNLPDYGTIKLQLRGNGRYVRRTHDPKIEEKIRHAIGEPCATNHRTARSDARNGELTESVKPQPEFDTRRR